MGQLMGMTVQVTDSVRENLALTLGWRQPRLEPGG